MGWIFQGNPEMYAIDDYVARYPELIYWRTPRYATEIQTGDRAFLWRSGTDAGAIGIGTVVEAPTPGTRVKHLEALGAELWRATVPDPDEVRTGIHLEEVRLTAEEGMLARDGVKTDDVLATSLIIRMPTGTVFPLTPDETLRFERLWGLTTSVPLTLGLEASEGSKKLRSHFRRERSHRLRHLKLEEFLRQHGRYFCELCRDDGVSRYPEYLVNRIFEVHHRQPLSLADTPVRTTLDDLAVLCATCHRAVHATTDVDTNFELLTQRFAI
jgi:hypothetical protein